MAVLKPELAPLLLTPSAEKKHRLLEAEGVDILLELPFTHELAAMSPEQFLDALCSASTVAGISVGSNWHFGKGGSGNADFLRAQAALRGFRACINDMLLEGEETVCSTAIRRHLAEGNITRANELLGRPFSVCGRVEHGQKLARKLGFPTANIALPANAAVPKRGVYAVQTRIRGELHTGIANIGLRPTIDEKIKINRLEAHFTSWKNGEFYGDILDVELLRFIRPETKFESIDALKMQIEIDLSSL
jgi:riboflavin kinase/FMN adenylyltransferase